MKIRGETRLLRRAGVVLLALSLWPSIARASADGADPVARTALVIALFLVVAKIAGDLAVRIGQPSVLGELCAGVLIGNLGLVGIHGLEPIRADPMIDMLARLGALILLFEVGLESTVDQMMKVGASAALVATLGVIAPFALGYGVSRLFLPESSFLAHAFIGATLTATSVGITARVMKDLNRSQSKTARIILGAAVIDDVLGLVILALVTGMVASADGGAPLSIATIAIIVAKALLFLVIALVAGRFISPKIFRAASRLQSRGVLVSIGLASCFALAWLASRIGLASIVGAFAAGLILEDVHYRSYAALGEQRMETLIQPISSFLVPIFFVLMGMRTDLRALASLHVVELAVALTVAAILGKQVCGLGVIGKDVDRISVGIGMIPRGEVGLIFADIGLGLRIHGERVLDDATFSAIVVMVILTTLITPPALKWSFGRSKEGDAGEGNTS